MKNKKIIKSLALVALASTFAIAIAASSRDGSSSGSASADVEGASTSITYYPDVRATSGCNSYATIGNALKWARDEHSGAYSSSAETSADDLPSYGGSVQASRAVSTYGGTVMYDAYWPAKTNN